MNTKEETDAKIHTTWIPQFRVAFFINFLSKTIYNRVQSILLDFHTIPLLTDRSKNDSKLQ